jgi:antitoxin (DNA-binding transcriptional repressor) of toxin-antitoxin stability system
VLITRHGKAVARLVPVTPSATEQRQQAVERLRQFRHGKTLGGLNLRDLRDQGRKR